MTNKEFIKIAINQDREDFIDHAKKLIAVVEIVSNYNFNHHKRCDIDFDGVCSCGLDRLNTLLENLEEDNKDE